MDEDGDMDLSDLTSANNGLQAALDEGVASGSGATMVEDHTDAASESGTPSTHFEGVLVVNIILSM